MATTAGDIYVRSGASGSFTSVQYVQGGWTTVPSASDMTGIYHDRLKDGQIIWVLVVVAVVVPVILQV